MSMASATRATRWAMPPKPKRPSVFPANGAAGWKCQCAGALSSQFAGKLRAKAPMVASTYSLIGTALAPRAEVRIGAARTSSAIPSTPVPIICTQRTPAAMASVAWAPKPPKRTSPRVPSGTPPAMSMISSEGKRSRMRGIASDGWQSTTTADGSSGEGGDTSVFSHRQTLVTGARMHQVAHPFPFSGACSG